ncbi:RPS6KA2, partial [Symbiodinium necroappetens]
ECAKFHIAGAARALGHLHSKRSLFRDLKPENVLLTTEGNVKIGDFGFAKQLVSSAVACSTDFLVLSTGRDLT